MEPGNFKFTVRFSWDGAKFSSINFKRRKDQHEPDSDVEDDLSIINGLTSSDFSNLSSKNTEPPTKKLKREDNVGKFNLVSFNYCVLKITDIDKNTDVWEETNAASPLCNRVLAVIKKEETVKNIKPFYRNWEEDIKHLIESGARFRHGEEMSHFSVEAMMVGDGKTDAALLGSTGGFCQLCLLSKEEAHTVSVIRDGDFPVRTLDGCWSTYCSLDKDEDGSVISHPEDYDTRKGQKQEPMALCIPPLCFGVTHQLIHDMESFFKLAVHIHAGYLCFVETKEWKPILKKSESVLQTELLKEGLRINFPDPAGGNSNRGNTSRKFFTPRVRDVLCLILGTRAGVPMEMVRSFSLLHQRVSVYLRVISCDQKIDLAKFKNFCTQTYVMLLERFSWFVLSPTLHKIIHAADVLAKTTAEPGSHVGTGGKKISEEAQESSNKSTAYSIDHECFTGSMKSVLSGILVKNRVRTDPGVKSFNPEKKCSACGDHNHNVRSCDKFSDLSSDDIMFRQFIVK